jgi:hypothetical protein
MGAKLILTAVMLGCMLATVCAAGAAEATDPKDLLSSERLRTKLPDDARGKISESLKQIARIAAPTLSAKAVAEFSAFTELIEKTSSVENSGDGRLIVLYSMLTDTFTLLHSENGKPVDAYVFNGSVLGYIVSAGKINEDLNWTNRFFRQRPKLQRDLVQIFSSDGTALTRELKRQQTEQNEVVPVV